MTTQTKQQQQPSQQPQANGAAGRPVNQAEGGFVGAACGAGAGAAIIWQPLEKSQRDRGM